MESTLWLAQMIPLEGRCLEGKAYLLIETRVRGLQHDEDSEMNSWCGRMVRQRQVRSVWASLSGSILQLITTSHYQLCTSTAHMKLESIVPQSNGDKLRQIYS